MAEIRAAMLARAGGAGEAPSGAPVSDVTQDRGAVTLMWETAEGHLCFAQAPVSGGSDVRLCADPERISPAAGSRVAKAYGTLTTPAGWGIVLLAERGVRVASVHFAGKPVEWVPVRTLAPEHSGRNVYYLTFPEYPVGKLSVLLDAVLTGRNGGEDVAERIRLAPEHLAARTVRD
ncbi:hypothetical protein ACFW2Y_32985, partial [Streptomyces sp. NPDC058877]|uniref:hypothetical protein n=1 Tax=Streptomyces sp. NPDC058877 TaxID=3346665 RepID=UPI0036781544